MKCREGGTGTPLSETVSQWEAYRRSGLDTRTYLVEKGPTIENRLRWVLDVAFREDESRVRQGHADENLAVLRHISLNLLRQEKSSRVGVYTKRLKDGWGNDYLQRVLDGVN